MFVDAAPALTAVPTIVTSFDIDRDRSIHPLYLEITRTLLLKILPEGSFLDYALTGVISEQDRKNFLSLLPFVTSRGTRQLTGDVSFYALSLYRSNSFKFFFEMISRWLIPGKRLNVVLINALDFLMPELNNDVYTLCEVIIQVEDSTDMFLIRKQLPILESEIRLGVDSSYYARRILEIRGLSVNEKTALVQEYIAQIISRWTERVSLDLMSEMQHVLVLCHDEFKEARNCHHLTKIITLQYIFRQKILKHISTDKMSRCLLLKLFKGQVISRGKERKVLCISVALNFIAENEHFDKQHILKAVQHFIPSAQPVEGSFFIHRRGNEPLRSFYIEVEKNGGGEFSFDELCQLKKELPAELKNRVEKLIHPVFMPRNEEETLRNMMTLAGQIRYIKDIPQAIISFEEQSIDKLSFCVIFARVCHPDVKSIQELFQETKLPIEYRHEQTKICGAFRKKYTKEVSLFHLRFRKEPFLRCDHTVDLFKARQEVFNWLQDVVGDVRDYNGGMISKQIELLESTKELLGDVAIRNEVLFQNFFFSLTPIVMRSVLEADALKKLFSLLIQTIDAKKEKRNHLALIKEKDFIHYFFKARLHERALSKKLDERLGALHLQTFDLAKVHVTFDGKEYFGGVYRCDNPEKQMKFIRTLKEVAD